MVKQVNPVSESASGATATAEAPPREKYVKQEWPRELLVDAEGNSVLNEEGKLTGTPACLMDPDHKTTVGEGDDARSMFTRDAYVAIKPTAFAEPYLATLYRADMCDTEIKRQEARAAKYRADAEVERTAGSKEAQAKVRRAAKLREQLAALEKQLAAEGISV